jgi:hypothetical protein
MTLPFSAREFFEVFARYNTAVWPVQIALVVAAMVVVVLAWRPRPGSERAIGVILGALWLWMAAVYHLIFFRTINPAATVFAVLFLAEAAILLFQVGWKGRVRFVRRPGMRGAVGALLVVFALAGYPALAHALGHRFPAMPTFGLPCPTVIFTLGVLAWAEPRPSWSMLAIPLAWSALGASAAVQLGVWEDLGLVAAGLVLVFYVVAAPPASTVPSPRPEPRRTVHRLPQ